MASNDETTSQDTQAQEDSKLAVKYLNRMYACLIGTVATIPLLVCAVVAPVMLPTDAPVGVRLSMALLMGGAIFLLGVCLLGFCHNLAGFVRQSIADSKN